MNFKDILYDIQSTRDKELINFNFPSSQKFFYINLETRKIEAPENLSVRFDHNAETIFFVVDRYFDTVDLTQQNCIVQYQNANPDKTKGTYLYYPSYYSLADDDTKIIFPWVIEGAATAYTGNVSFAVRFYTLNPEKEFIYNLNTVPSSSKVLYGMDATGLVSDYIYEADPAQDILNRIIILEDKISNLGDGDFDSEDIINLNKRIDDLEEVVKNLDYGNINPEEIIEIKNKLAELEISLGILNKDIQDLKDSQKIENESIENIQNTINKLDENISNIKSQLESAILDTEEKFSIIENLIMEKADQNTVSIIEADLNELKENLSTVIIDLDKKVNKEEYNEKISSLENDINTLSSRVTTVEENDNNMSSQISSIEESNRNLSTQIINMEEDIKEINQSLSNLNTQIYWLEIS